MKEEPLISIIVPVYNVEKYLTRCIKSILRQTYNNFELLLIDDGSPDDCPALCDEWAKKDSRIKVFHKTNGGLSDARNYGIAKANSEYITFIDSDDGVSPDYLEHLYSILTKHDADISSAKYKVINDETEIPLENIEQSLSYVVDSVCACKELFTNKKVITMAWGKLYRKEIINCVSFPVGRNYEDCATVCKYLYACRFRRNRIAVSQAPVYYACGSNKSSICHTRSFKNVTDSIWAEIERARFFTRAKEKDLSKFAWNAAAASGIQDFCSYTPVRGRLSWLKFLWAFLFEAKVGFYLKAKVVLAFFFPKVYKKLKEKRTD